MYVPSRYHRRSPTEVTLADDPVDAQIDRINELTRVGRANWFGLLAYLAFATVTLLGVEHADFFLDTRQTTLPLIGVSIPTFSFFIFAPILGTALYVYLHLHIRKLGEAIAIPDPFPKQPDVPLERHLNSWLLVDTLMHFRRDGAIAQRNLDLLARWLTVLLVWAAGPAVLFLFWVISWPAHDEWLTLGLLALLILATWTGFNSWLETQRAIRKLHPMNRYFRVAISVTCLVTIGAAAHLSWVKTESGGVPRLAEGTLSFWQEIAPINLRGLQAVDLPPEQLDYVAARQAFRRDWCARQSLTMAQCGWHVDWDGARPARVTAARAAWCDANRDQTGDACTGFFSDLEDRFHREWRAFRLAQLAALNPPDLSGQHLRNADLREAILSGADLRDAQMQGAVLRSAQMQGAILVDAQLQGAVLNNAQMQGVSLTFVQMQEASLLYAQMQGAILVDAQLQEANLAGAQMQGAILWRAQMQGANLGRAQMQGAYLGGAQMQGANLGDAQMQGANLGRAQMSADTDLTDATLRGAAVRSVDGNTIAHLAAFWDVLFADGTIRPDDPGRPTHWATDELEYRPLEVENSPFHQAWRAWAAEHHPDVPLAFD